MTTFDTGRQAEAAAAEYLKQQGYQVVAQNWRTRYCEIDIVARKADTVHFIEVKYRQSNAQGAGLDYVTSKKLRQMSFAAEMWVQNHRWSGEYGLGAMEVSGPSFQIDNLITEL